MPPKKKEQELQELENKQNKLLEKIQSLKGVLMGELEDKKKNNPKKEEEVEEAPKEVPEEITEKELRSEKNLNVLRNKLTSLARSKVPIKGDLSKEQIKTQQKKTVDRLIKKDAAKYLKYEIRSRDALNTYDRDKVIQLILELAKAPTLTDEEIKGGAYEYKRPKNAADSDKSIKIMKELLDEETTNAKLKRAQEELDKLIEMNKADPSDETKARIKESGEITKQIIGELHQSSQKDQYKEQYSGMFEDVDKRLAKVDLSGVKVDQPVIMNDAKALNDAIQKNIKTQEDMKQLMKQANEERLARQGKSPSVKDTASKPQSDSSRKIPVVIKAEEKKEEPYTPLPVVGTDYRGSKEMFVKPEQKPLEPFGGLQSQNEVEAPYLSTKSDKAIGDVRQVGFIGAQDQLAKVEDVTLEPSERSKSLKRFTNFRWVQSVQNSDLGYASPFQRMDDIDDRRRFGKCFMHANKMPKDPDTQDELDKAKAFNTYSLVPSFDMSSRMQPAGNLSFINSTSKFARKLTADEMEPINQGKRNVNNDKNKLEFTTILHSDDPLKRIKDKYKNNIIC